MGSELGFAMGGLAIGIIVGVCWGSIYWTKRIQEKKDNKLRKEIQETKNKIAELNTNGK